MQNLFLALIMSLMVIQPEKKNEDNGLVVLELFTSQGCSSCPKADELLGEIKEKHSSKNVIALSYHVDYWNYIGWKDPFSKKAFSDKQRAYSIKFNSSTIYTPQIVVNGEEHFVGSKREVMQNKLDVYSKKGVIDKIVLDNVKRTKEKVHFNYNINGDMQSKHLRIALVINERETPVNRGENRNRVLKNFNIVVNETYLEANKAGEASITIPSIVAMDDKLSLVALVETKDLSITGGLQLGL